MFRLFILMYGLSLTEAYTIKLAGTVELGNQLSKLFKEMYAQLAENGYFPDRITNSQNNQQNPNEHGDDASPHNEEYNDGKSDEKGKKSKCKNVKDMPILDKMMKNDLEKLHLYGLHTFEEKKNDGKPLNNINI